MMTPYEKSKEEFRRRTGYVHTAHFRAGWNAAIKAADHAMARNEDVHGWGDTIASLATKQEVPDGD